MYELGGVPVEQDNRLPLSKIEAICLPKGNSINREFWIDSNEMVWGYFDKIVATRYHKVYLSEKAFIKLKNGNLTDEIN